MAAEEFDKDFGYLMPFIDKVIEAANRATDAATRAELLELVGGQKQRWARIGELLSGQTAATAPSAATERAEAPVPNKPVLPAGEALTRRMAETEAARRAFTGVEARSFTVGSLRPRRR
ncbi:MAG TPA: hypothetical protein VKC34_03015 [Blastocatellia bacterium]|nr:hypothetical protein [Blastocatellia bacterium]